MKATVHCPKCKSKRIEALDKHAVFLQCANCGFNALWGSFVEGVKKLKGGRNAKRRVPAQDTYPEARRG